MVMCSDFSLKALIKQWCPRRLGPNPFVKVGEFGGTMNIKFDSARVAECPSQQLQKAGELSESGTATIHAMSGTIVYTVDKTVGTGDRYDLEVLSVATCSKRWDLPQNQVCTIGDSTGTAGHVILSYRSRVDSPGLLLTSAGHWVELVKLDNVSEEKLLQSASCTYGAAYAQNWSMQMASASTPQMRSDLCQSFAQQMVQQSSPCVQQQQMPSMQQQMWSAPAKC